MTTNPTGQEALIERIVLALEDDPFVDDNPVVGTTGHDMRLRHYAALAVEALSSTPESKTPSREEIARVIDPDIWALRDIDRSRRDDWENGIKAGWGDTTFEQWSTRGLEPSLAKADAILALLSSPTRGRVR